MRLNQLKTTVTAFNHDVRSPKRRCDRYLDYGWVRSASWAKATHCVAFGVETEMVICDGGGGELRGVESRV